MKTSWVMVWAIVKYLLLGVVLTAESLAAWHRDWVEAIFWVLLLISVKPLGQTAAGSGTVPQGGRR